MIKKFRPYDSNQTILLPPSLDDRLLDDNLAHLQIDGYAQELFSKVHL